MKQFKLFCFKIVLGGSYAGFQLETKLGKGKLFDIFFNIRTKHNKYTAQGRVPVYGRVRRYVTCKYSKLS